MTIEAMAQKTIQLASGVLNTIRFRLRTNAGPPTAAPQQTSQREGCYCELPSVYA